MRVKLLQLVVVTLSLQACASGQMVASINQSQQQQSELLAQQQALLQEQNQKIEYLQLLQGALNHMVSEMAVEVELVNERLASAKTTDATATRPVSIKPSSTKTKTAPVALNGKVVLGRLEYVWVDALDKIFEAEINTGMRNSLLYVKSATVFERDGQDWVRFELLTVADKDDKKKADEQIDKLVFEAPVASYTKIRTASGEQYEKRPSIKTNVRIGTLVEQAEFVLTPATKLSTPIVLGRNFLRDIAIVDVARKHTQPKHKPKSL